MGKKAAQKRGRRGDLEDQVGEKQVRCNPSLEGIRWVLGREAKKRSVFSYRKKGSEEKENANRKKKTGTNGEKEKDATKNQKQGHVAYLKKKKREGRQQRGPRGVTENRKGSRKNRGESEKTDL